MDAAPFFGDLENKDRRYIQIVMKDKRFRAFFESSERREKARREAAKNGA